MSATGVRRRKRAAFALILAVVVAMPSVASAAEAPPPSAWPSSAAASPRIEGSAHAVRFAGADRYSTSLALALGLRGSGGYPFTTPDRSSGGATTLASADHWWGVGVCPRAVIVVAGDSPADALAASALSDPTGESTEPYLQRSAAADPLFDPVGGFARVDTDSAPIIVTRSARQGATGLSTAAHLAAQDLHAGGCTDAQQAIVVGGTAAVPTAVDDELVAIGYAEVFRVSGPNRFATAAAVAQGLGTAPAPGGATACTDPSAADGDARMDFYANSVVELRESGSTCRLLGRTVVLTDGITGADALAAGWWTSFWQVPVLLHDGSSALPPATVAALETLDVDNIVMLGGTARLSDDVVAQAVDLTGAAPIRISGPDRYATSVAMAQQFGGWWPTGRGDEYAGSLVCLAGSSGNGPGAVGWPDALAAGPWCAGANGAAANPGAPDRALSPTTGGAPITASGQPARPAHDAVPVLLVPAGSAQLPTSVATLLTSAFEPADNWCSSVSATAGCLYPGFVVAVGGTAAVGEGALAQASTMASGGAANGGDHEPTRGPGFHTTLDMAPVFDVAGAGSQRVCVPRGGYSQLRWLAVFADPGASRLVGSNDIMLGARYVDDGDGTVRSPGSGAPVCAGFAPTADSTATVRGVSPSGRATPISAIAYGLEHRFTLTAPISVAAPNASSGVDSSIDTDAGGTTTWTFLAPAPAAGAVSRGASTTIDSAATTITLTRGDDVPGVVAPDTFTASWSLSTPLGAVTGTATGEAILSGGTWRLRGRSSFGGGTWNVASGSGGFVADVVNGAGAGHADDAIAWRIDGLVAG